MENDSEKESLGPGNLGIIKSEKHDGAEVSTEPAQDSSISEKPVEDTVNLDPGVYQLKSERLEKAMQECQQEITFLMDLLKNKCPKSSEENSHEK